jgi:hypothetical protein
VTPTFAIKRGDTAPPLRRVFRERTLRPADLTDAAVRFLMSPLDVGGPTVDAPADVTDPVAGAVEYHWAAGDTATAGRYRAEFQATFPGGEVRTDPPRGYIGVIVSQELG